jgi:hypothetical protein
VTARCACGQPSIGLAVSYRAINAVERYSRQQDRKEVMDLNDLLALPEALWKPVCPTCADKGTYCIDYDRIQTVEQALDWTLHLSGKTWFPSTNWREVMYGLFPKVRDAA